MQDCREDPTDYELVKSVSCVYCHAQSELTRDHVPPKLLFSPPFPRNLITVPSCASCNASFQLDDEYFRAALVMRADLAQNDDARAPLDRTLRALKRHQGAGLTKRFIRSLTKKDVWSREGILLGQAGAYEVDNARLERTLVRIVRGLYFHETRSRFGLRINIRAHIGFEEDAEMKSDAIQMLAGQPIRAVGRTFRYAWVQAQPRSSFTCWILEFFGRVPFLVVSVDAEDVL